MTGGDGRADVAYPQSWVRFALKLMDLVLKMTWPDGTERKAAEKREQERRAEIYLGAERSRRGEI